jgi:hypothetical protein
MDIDVDTLLDIISQQAKQMAVMHAQMVALQKKAQQPAPDPVEDMHH